ncbi:MAG TPA: hypothetical protein VMR25_04705 [Planctomycetaceae bacterium]|nr:hypothetical protein [Planctomycetaceae bacterium]
MHFALGDYRRAAAAAHPVLNARPGWDWILLCSFYPSVDVYTRQLRALEKTVSDHADEPAPRFVLAYHYLMLGHLSAARAQLTHVVELEPRDLLAKHILEDLANVPWTDTATLQIADQGAADRTARALIDLRGPATAQVHPAISKSAEPLVGKWTSHPLPGVSIEATFEPNGRFNWKYTDGRESRLFSGTYIHQGGGLIFSRSDGQRMNGLVTKAGIDGIWFRLKDADPNDPGLVFSK